MPPTRKAIVVARDSGWEYQHRGREFFQKDGYEVYFYPEDGFELTIRDHETMERRAVFKERDIDIHDPMYTALLCHVLENAERIVNESS